MIHVYWDYLTLKQISKKTHSVFQARCNVRSPNAMMMSPTSFVWTVYQQSTEGKILHIVTCAHRALLVETAVHALYIQ